MGLGALYGVAEGTGEGLQQILEQRMAEAQMRAVQERLELERQRIEQQAAQHAASLSQDESQFGRSHGLNLDQFRAGEPERLVRVRKGEQDIKSGEGKLSDEAWIRGLRLRDPKTLGPVERTSLGLGEEAPEVERGWRAGESEKTRAFQSREGAADRGAALERTRLMSQNEPVVAVRTVDDQGKAITRYVPRSQAAGQDFEAQPTAEIRNRSAATGRAGSVLASVDELSQKINTQEGVIAKITGETEKVAARANLADDVAEYQALVSGFTPLLARAVGHTGVLTELDVESVRRMLPQPGDSKAVRDRKMARVTKIWTSMNAPSGEETGASAAPATKRYNPKTGRIE